MFAIFENAWVRFALSGTLIALYGIAEHLARRRTRGTSKPPSPKWVRPLLVISLTPYYVLIGPTGGPLLGGIGNLLGVALVLLSMALRFVRSVRYPELAGRALLYIGLPVAVGVPWGLLALSLPAMLSSLHCVQRAERLQGAAASVQPTAAYRLVPGVLRAGRVRGAAVLVPGAA